MFHSGRESPRKKKKTISHLKGKAHEKEEGTNVASSGRKGGNRKTVLSPNTRKKGKKGNRRANSEKERQAVLLLKGIKEERRRHSREKRRLPGGKKKESTSPRKKKSLKKDVLLPIRRLMHETPMEGRKQRVVGGIRAARPAREEKTAHILSTEKEAACFRSQEKENHLLADKEKGSSLGGEGFFSARRPWQAKRNEKHRREEKKATPKKEKKLAEERNLPIIPDGKKRKGASSPYRNRKKGKNSTPKAGYQVRQVGKKQKILPCSREREESVRYFRNRLGERKGEGGGTAGERKKNGLTCVEERSSSALRGETVPLQKGKKKERKKASEGKESAAA